MLKILLSQCIHKIRQYTFTRIRFRKERVTEEDFMPMAKKLTTIHKLTGNGNWIAMSASLRVNYNIHQNCKVEFKRQELVFLVQDYIPGVEYYASKRLYKFTIT